MVLTLALLGAFAAMRADRLAGVLLILAISGGVLWSNILAYGGVNLAPYGQLRELERIGHEFAGQGPALMTEYNPYGARHFLREEDGEGASELRQRAVTLRGGGSARKGEAVDTDRIEPGSLLEFRTLVLRRSPLASRPPLPYRLAWSGRYYEVWQRPQPLLRPRPGSLAARGKKNPAPCLNAPRSKRSPTASKARARAPGSSLPATPPSTTRPRAASQCRVPVTTRPGSAAARAAASRCRSTITGWAPPAT